MTDIANLGIQIDSSQVKDASSDLDKLAGAAAKAEKQAANFERNFGKAADAAEKTGNAAKGAGDKVSASIDKQIKALEAVVATQGRSARQTKLYELAQAGASRAQLESADSALRMREAFLKSQDATEGAIRNLKRFAVAASVAATAAVAAFAIIAQRAIDQASNFKDLGEVMGDTAEAVASLQAASATSGKSLDEVASFSVKLNKALSKTDDESKAAARGLAALGIKLQDFKKASPVEQLDLLSKALQGFNDGPGKGAALEAIARGGAQLLPFLNDLADKTERQTRLTSEQIDVIDAFGKKQDETKDKITALAQVILAESIPALNTFIDQLLKTTTEALGLNTTSDKLGGNTGIRDFAQGALVALQTLLDSIADVVRGLSALGGSIKVIAADIRIAGKIGELAINPVASAKAALTGYADIRAAYAEREKTIATANQGYEVFVDKLRNSNAKKLRGLFDQQNRVSADPEVARLAARARAAAGAGLKDVDQRGLNTDRAPKGKKDNTAAQEAKAQLAADLDEIRNRQEALLNTYSNAEKVLEAKRAAGLTDEREYYGEKKRLLDLNNAAQEEGLQKEIARMQQEKLSGKEAIDNQRKIADAQAKLLKVRENATTNQTILDTQAAASIKKIEVALLSARQAAQDYFDTVNKGYEREIGAIGKGDKNRSFQSAITQIEDKYQQQRRDLQNNRAQSELAGTFGPEAQRQYDKQLAIINEFQSKAIDSYKKYYDTLDLAQKDWTTGATEALQNYYDESQNIAKQTQEAFTNAFKGMEDALVEFVTTGKLDFKSLVDSIIKDIARIVIKQQITGPLANALNGVFGGGTGGGSSGGGGGGDIFGSLLGSLFGSFGGLSNGAATTAANLSGGGLDDLLKYTGNFSRRAIGGPVSPNSVYQVAEKGPEIANIAGKQYLMTGKQGGQVSPMSAGGGAGGVTQNITYVLQNPASKETQAQISRRTYQAADMAYRKNS
jgi:lambda family phage tail tape measure protein